VTVFASLDASFGVDDPIGVLERERHIDWHHEAAMQQIPCRERRARERNALPIKRYGGTSTANPAASDRTAVGSIWLIRPS
jgi:hypothetical protein